MADIYVYPSYVWTCQHCHETVTGFETEQKAITDSETHECEVSK